MSNSLETYIQQNYQWLPGPSEYPSEILATLVAVYDLCGRTLEPSQSRLCNTTPLLFETNPEEKMNEEGISGDLLI